MNWASIASYASFKTVQRVMHFGGARKKSEHELVIDCPNLFP